MSDPRVKLKNRWVAGLLAYLVPGAGHLYQGRYFKAGIYFVSIMGTFVWGCSLGEANAVHLRWDTAENRGPKQRMLGFIAQAGIGMAAIPAYVQYERVNAQDLTERSDQAPHAVLETFDAEFAGFASHREQGHGRVTGRMSGQVTVGDYGVGAEFNGKLVGKLSDGRDVEWTVSGPKYATSLGIGPRVTGLDEITEMSLDHPNSVRTFSKTRRRFHVRIVDDATKTQDLGEIHGSIPRPLTDCSFAPLSDEGMQHLHGRLGKFYELALVYTWIAGLLNVLAVWDAIEGPAYGYGDEVADEPAAPPASEGANVVAVVVTTPAPAPAPAPQPIEKV